MIRSFGNMKYYVKNISCSKKGNYFGNQWKNTLWSFGGEMRQPPRPPCKAVEELAQGTLGPNILID